jgi:hypothetical protein
MSMQSRPKAITVADDKFFTKLKSLLITQKQRSEFILIYRKMLLMMFHPLPTGKIHPVPGSIYLCA